MAGGRVDLRGSAERQVMMLQVFSVQERTANEDGFEGYRDPEPDG